MTMAQLEALMLKGDMPSAYEGQLFHLIEEASIVLLTGAVKQLAIQKQVKPKQIWKNLAQLAIAIQSPKPFWQALNG